MNIGGFAIPHDALMRAMGNQNTPPRPIPEAQIERIQEVYEAYQRQLSEGCPFKPGDLVTPTMASQMRDQGEPWIVLEVIDKAEPHFTDDPSGISYGQRCDMRVAHLSLGTVSGEEAITKHWVESHEFVAYVPA